MKHLYDKEDILTYKTDEIPLDTIVIIKTKRDEYKGRLTLNNKDCISIDYPKELKGTYLARDGIESIRVLRNFSDLMSLIIKKDGANNMSKKEQLLNELEQIKKEFKEKIENVQKKIEQEDNKNKWWTPKEGEGYYYICTDGYVQRALNTGVDIDKCKINNINCYKTEQQAERQAFEQLLHRKLNRFALENNEEEIDWNNPKQTKYRITFQADDLLIGWINITYKEFGQVYFTSAEATRKAIDEFKEDLIRYFTSNK